MSMGYEVWAWATAVVSKHAAAKIESFIARAISVAMPLFVQNPQSTEASSVGECKLRRSSSLIRES
ncbi:MAG TPA: hypothetical protein VML55_06370, partial [Planctomycetaceae bacterium]|nr:hypothetical protein [Planctomycetaceae bacterium]